jgi:membrane carboxypeptidase/penicillin-binding protein
MRKAVASKPAADFPRPDTVVSVAIDPATGCLATEDSPEHHDEFYIVGTEPGDYCPKPGEDDAKPLSPPLLQPSKADGNGQPPEPGAEGVPKGGKE